MNIHTGTVAAIRNRCHFPLETVEAISKESDLISLVIRSDLKAQTVSKRENKI
jgi:hypothetical protein